MGEEGGDRHRAEAYKGRHQKQSMKNTPSSLLWPVVSASQWWVSGHNGHLVQPSLFIQKIQVLRRDLSEAALSLGASLSSPRQGRVPTGRAVKLGEKPVPGEKVSDLLRLGPVPPPSFCTCHRAFICAPSGYFARSQGLWAGPAGSCGNSCVHPLNLMLHVKLVVHGQRV